MLLVDALADERLTQLVFLFLATGHDDDLSLREVNESDLVGVVRQWLSLEQLNGIWKEVLRNTQEEVVRCTEVLNHPRTVLEKIRKRVFELDGHVRKPGLSEVLIQGPCRPSILREEGQDGIVTALGRDVAWVEVRSGVRYLVHRLIIDDIAIFLVRINLAGQLMREIAQYQHQKIEGLLSAIAYVCLIN